MRLRNAFQPTCACLMLCPGHVPDAPRVFCYKAPQFNIWRVFHEVSFEVTSQGAVPFVHAAADDSLHGIIDKHVKAKRSKQARAEGRVLPEVGVETLRDMVVALAGGQGKFD